VLILVRSLMEATGVRTKAAPHPVEGVDVLISRRVLPEHMRDRARDVFRTAHDVVDGKRPARPDDSAAALAFALALLACVYIDRGRSLD
jgi:hypothetical protein